MGAKRTLAAMTASIALGLAAAGPVTAQEETSENRVDAITDWAVFEDTDPTECWAVTTFKESVNTRDGRVVSVTRGEILLMAFFRPDDGIEGQVAFTGGYPFADESTVNVDIDGTEFELFTEGEWAWPATPQDDQRIVTAMKRGTEAVLTAVSSRGTTTEDTFSLLGFTAAFDDAAQRCSS